MIWLIGILLLVGLILLVAGLRGRLINDHPICRKCGFDLIGIKEKWEAAQTEGFNPNEQRWRGQLCGECGVNLKGSGAVVWGVRKRLNGRLFGGLLLLLISAGIYTAVALNLFEKIDWQGLKSTLLHINDRDPE